jgi:O-methyltransferase involved in polyketide biosynthesis
MNNVNKTLYIPLYGKAYVSRKGIILSDRWAEEIWEAEGFKLKGKSKSKWLAYYMGIRSAVFDSWVKDRMAEMPDAAVIHIGCGMDSRVLRVGTNGHVWYDVDFPEVISERGKYYTDTTEYKMLVGDARDKSWLDKIPESKSVIVVMEGVSMYLAPEETKGVLDNLGSHFESVSLLMDCYSVLAAKMSKYKNPVNDVGVTKVYGIDDPKVFCGSLDLVGEREMTPLEYINQLEGSEKRIFAKVYAGNFAKKLYRMYEYKKN